MRDFLLGLTPGAVLAGVESATPDLSWLQAFGAAAPFAALAFWQMTRAQKRLDEKDTEHAAEVRELRRENADLQKAALQREQQLVAGLGPRIYDAALLYHEGNKLAEQVSTPPPAAPATVDHRLDDLTKLVERLVTGIGQGDADGDNH